MMTMITIHATSTLGKYIHTLVTTSIHMYLPTKHVHWLGIGTVSIDVPVSTYLHTCTCLTILTHMYLCYHTHMQMFN